MLSFPGLLLVGDASWLEGPEGIISMSRFARWWGEKVARQPLLRSCSSNFIREHRKKQGQKLLIKEVVSRRKHLTSQDLETQMGMERSPPKKHRDKHSGSHHIPYGVQHRRAGRCIRLLQKPQQA